MTWQLRLGMGVAVLAALAVGRAVDVALPIEHVDDRPFVRAAAVGDRVALAYADVTVDAVRSGRNLDTGGGTIGTPGRWLVVDVTVIARHRPLAAPGISLEDASGRSFRVDPRSGYAWDAVPTGVPWQVQVPFEVPEDALPGATFVFTRRTDDDRRDDQARVDLGIGAGDAKELWADQRTIELHPARMVTP